MRQPALRRYMDGHAALVNSDKDGMPSATTLPEKQHSPQYLCACPYVGVTVIKGRCNAECKLPFRSQIWLPDIRERKYLGYFRTAKEAALAHDDAVRQVDILSTMLLRVTGCLRTFLYA